MRPRHRAAEEPFSDRRAAECVEVARTYLVEVKPVRRRGDFPGVWLREELQLFDEFISNGRERV